MVAWYSHLFKNFPQFVVIHMIKSFNIVHEAEVDVFLDSLSNGIVLKRKNEFQIQQEVKK